MSKNSISDPNTDKESTPILFMLEMGKFGFYSQQFQVHNVWCIEHK